MPPSPRGPARSAPVVLAMTRRPDEPLVADVQPLRLVLERSTGRLAGPVRRYEKRFSDLLGLYLDEQAFRARWHEAGDPLAYSVEDFRVDAPGSLVVGTTVLEPGVVGEEYAMTRGHIHVLPSATEIYYCVSGHGVLVMEDLGGESSVLELSPDCVGYVPGGWIHRSVNVGTDPLVVLFVYEANAGQDYGIVEAACGLSKLVVVNGDGWMLVPNPRYVPRTVPR